MNLSGEVIVPSFTFIATAHAMNWIGLEPVFADVEPGSHTLDPISVVRCISPRTTAILPVHLWGNVCSVDVLRCIAAEYGLRLLYDSSHAFGCALNGQSIGNFGDAEVFSFMPRNSFIRWKEARSSQMTMRWLIDVAGCEHLGSQG